VEPIKGRIANSRQGGGYFSQPQTKGKRVVETGKKGIKGRETVTKSLGLGTLGGKLGDDY